ncbi:MAG TPA: aldolase/citrate lyase family protein [Bacteroidales bacterium]|nr:aldolase/citrate lyase family protein [Bacteroidales bacterium]
MTNLEKKMIDALKDLKENHHVIGVKAEFEAEGTRLEEALRLKEIISKADLEMTIKIGGCEALKDLYDARAIGVSRIVAPMIESPFALLKYLEATHLAFPKEEWDEISFLINIETKVGYSQFDSMLSMSRISELAGIVLGRGDLACSLGMTRNEINHDDVFKITSDALTKAKKHNLETVIGGGVSGDSIPFFKNLPEGCLDKFETRKVLFAYREPSKEKLAQGILKAVGFELMWLRNKRDFYGLIYNEDKARIENLESRYAVSIKAAGGSVS